MAGMAKTVFLVGPRASGKTSLGDRVAGKLGVAFLDTDEFICGATGLTVAEVVTAEGWEGFRRRESDALREAAKLAQVVATGGGAVLSPENRAFMRDCGVVFYLSAPVAELSRRLALAPNRDQRPSLTGKAVADELAEVVRLREPLYLAIAHHVIDATRDIDRLAEDVARLIEALE